MSIQVKPFMNINDFLKDLEVRKRIPKGYVGPVYFYVTKADPLFWLYTIPFANQDYDGRWDRGVNYDIANGKVAASFWFDDYETISFFSEYKSDGKWGYVYMQEGSDRNISRAEFLRRTCLTEKEVVDYTGDNGKPFYAIHIKKLNVFLEPLYLSDFYRERKSSHKFSSEQTAKGLNLQKITKAPQSWMYAWMKVRN